MATKNPTLCARLKNKRFFLAFFLASSDGARHSTVCVRGQEHPRGHGPRRPGLLLVCASVQLWEIRQRSVSFDEPHTSFSGQSAHFLRRVGSERPRLRLSCCVQCWLKKKANVDAVYTVGLIHFWTVCAFVMYCVALKISLKGPMCKEMETRTTTRRQENRN